MSILVTGGTGTLGRVVVPELRDTGADVRVLSHRRSGSGIVTGDLVARAGLPAALRGVHTVVHLATTGNARDIRAMANLTSAASAAGVRHLIYLSIVGVDAVPLPYYRAKLECERQLQSAGLPWTVLRATQFHDLVWQIFAAQRRSPWLFVPDIPIQPVDTSVVAARLVQLAAEPPAGRVADLGGPRVQRLLDLAHDFLAATGRPGRRIVQTRLPGRIFAAYAAGGHLAPGEAAVGTPDFADFCARRTRAQEPAAPLPGAAPGARRQDRHPGATSRTHQEQQASGPRSAYPGDFLGMPSLDYAPRPDGRPDPGEIVWTWVPFEEDHTRGKDRPVLLVGRDGPWLLAVPLTSKDHDRDAAQEHTAGREWVDVGSGGWDTAGRPSEARVDRIVRVDPTAVRREGAVLGRHTFAQVAAAIRGRVTEGTSLE